MSETSETNRSAAPELVLTPALLAELAAHAESVGLLRLGAVDLAHPGFLAAGAALERFLAAGKAGDMDFLPRTRAVRQDPARMLPGARSVLVAAVPYTGESGPVARYARGLDYHTVVHQRLIAVERRLHALLPGVATLICVDTKPLLERSADRRALGRLRRLHALPRRLPDGRLRRPWRPRSAPLHQLPDDRAPRCRPRRPRRPHGRAHRRLRRVPGGLPVQRQRRA